MTLKDGELCSLYIKFRALVLYCFGIANMGSTGLICVVVEILLELKLAGVDFFFETVRKLDNRVVFGNFLFFTNSFIIYYLQHLFV